MKTKKTRFAVACISIISALILIITLILSLIGTDGGKINEAQKDVVKETTQKIIYDESQTLDYLTVNFKVTYDTQTSLYEAEVTAFWQAKLTPYAESFKSAEEFSDDFIAITWGGEGYIKAEEESFQGEYYNGKPVKGVGAVSNSYYGFAWAFREKSGLFGKEMKSAVAKVKFGSYKENQGKPAAVKMTYIHTYTKSSHLLALQKVGTYGTNIICSDEYDGTWRIESDCSINY